MLGDREAVCLVAISRADKNENDLLSRCQFCGRFPSLFASVYHAERTPELTDDAVSSCLCDDSKCSVRPYFLT